MILSAKRDVLSIPHTSKCVIKSVGEIHDGESVEISSPLFPSFDLTTDALNSSTKFSVPLRIQNSVKYPNGYITSDGNTEATLVCDDNDTTNMYVKMI